MGCRAGTASSSQGDARPNEAKAESPDQPHPNKRPSGEDRRVNKQWGKANRTCRPSKGVCMDPIRTVRCIYLCGGVDRVQIFDPTLWANLCLCSYVNSKGTAPKLRSVAPPIDNTSSSSSSSSSSDGSLSSRCIGVLAVSTSCCGCP